MLAIADEAALYLLEFVSRRNLKKELECLQQKTMSTIVPGSTPPLHSIEKELDRYFARTLQTFTTPTHIFGSPFQKQVWNTLKKIPYGQTCSYSQLAAMIGKPSACRAVAKANGANQLALIIPCHRVINANGKLGGYAGGTERKSWLLHHEKSSICSVLQ